MNNLERLYELDIPWSNTIELLNACNMKCIHCYLATHSSIGLSTDKVLDVLTQLREMGAFSVVLTGGEIFLRHDLVDIVRFARDIGMSVSLFSNATVNIEDGVLDVLDKINIHLFSTTIFSMENCIHDAITTMNGSLESTLGTLSKLKAKGIPIEVKIPIMGINYRSYSSVISYCKENHFLFRVETNITPKNNGDIAPTRLRISRAQLLDVIADNFQKQELKVTRKPRDFLCNTLRSGLHISCEGDVYPCVGFPKSMGNLNEKSIKEIWRSEEYVNLRGMRIQDMARCGNCENVDFCTVCPANVYVENDSAVCGCPSSNRINASG